MNPHLKFDSACRDQCTSTPFGNAQHGKQQNLHAKENEVNPAEFLNSSAGCALVVQKSHSLHLLSQQSHLLVMKYQFVKKDSELPDVHIVYKVDYQHTNV